MKTALVGLRTALRMARLRRAGVIVDRTVTMAGHAPVVTNGGAITLERGVQLRGAAAPVRLTTARGGEIVIRQGVYLNTGINIFSAARVEIGSFTRIADDCAIYDSNFHAVDEGRPVKIAPVTIGHNAWLGRAVIVLPGVTIGDHSVIAAGSVVGRDVPPRQLWGGNPAVYIRDITASDGFIRS